MALTLIGTGDVFGRLLALHAPIGSMRSSIGSLETLRDAINTEFVGSLETYLVHRDMFSLFESAVNANSPFFAALYQDIRSSLRAQCGEEVLVLRNPNDDAEALAILIDEMLTQSKVVETEPGVSVPAAPTADADNTGDVEIAIDGIWEDGNVCQYLRHEVALFTCQNETGYGTLLLRGEPVSVPWTNDWTNGSAGNTVIQVTDPDGGTVGGQVAQGKNAVYNAYEWNESGATTIGFTAVSGTFGSDIDSIASANSIRSGRVLRFIGRDGTGFPFNPRVRQTFGNSDQADGSISTLRPGEKHWLSFWVKASAADVGTGTFNCVVTINGTAVATITMDLSAMPTTMTFKKVAFYCPDDLVDGTDKIEIGVLDATGAQLDDLTTIDVDLLTVTPAYYHAGLYLGAFPGAVDPKLEDRWTAQIVHSTSSSVTWAMIFDRAFDMLSRRLIIPHGTSNVAEP
jgi:hypothetical protein